MLHLVRPSDSDLHRVLEKSREAKLSYAEVGATKSRPLPAGYRLDYYERRLGSEEGRFESAVDALRRWQGQIGAGVQIFPDGAAVEIDSTVLFVLRTMGLWAVAPAGSSTSSMNPRDSASPMAHSPATQSAAKSR